MGKVDSPMTPRRIAHPERVTHSFCAACSAERNPTREIPEVSRRLRGREKSRPTLKARQPFRKTPLERCFSSRRRLFVWMYAPG
ncbi:hypothetical protein CEXT_401651 [Caerostris extrusa]|uniref:Uncharacterized protein n=1 Tax=Caerostris extrusa TaxID=172846 RepID=A0AAV4M6K4_CAEEX|nr:hypothetical protein CEXT_401651 [Caerostris extrusa]